MKHTVTISAFLLLFACTLSAKPIDENTARKAALQWMLTRANSESKEYSVYSVHPVTSDERTTCYFVNLHPDGVVLVSADDIAIPILMYTETGRYDGETLPDGLASLVSDASDEINQAITMNLEAPVETTIQWLELLENRGVSQLGSGQAVLAVPPLISSKWHQNFPYNKDCPTTPSGGSGGYVYAGCVATTMAQIMRYYGAPVTGQSSHSYVHPVYGLQSVNYGTSTYNWSNMPNSINSSSSSTVKNAIAKLIYHCAVAVNMDFSPNGSGAILQDAGTALKNFFRYKTTISYKWKTSYSASGWVSLLINELNNGRPVMYRGSNLSGAGHAWILDGYSGNDYFHMNYGWGGYLDGYFYLNSITPGSYNFTYYQGAVIGIEPQSIATPALNNPADQAVNQCITPTLSWNHSSGADTYHLQISRVSTFATTVTDQMGLTNNFYNAGPLEIGSTYFWRVRASGTAGVSPWTASRSFTVLNAVISASGPVEFCEGGSVTLSTVNVAGVSYSWLRNGVPIQGASQRTIDATTSGSYVVQLVQGNCTTASDPFSVTVYARPVAIIFDNDTIHACQGSGGVLNAQQISGADYQWKRNGVPLPGATTSSWVASESGSYTVKVSVGTCSTESSPTEVILFPLDPTSLEWTGNISNDWYTFGNWDNPCAIPTPGDDVTIPANTQPPAEVPNMVLHDLTLANAAGVSLGGNLHVSGTLHLQAGIIDIDKHNLIFQSGAGISGGGTGTYIATSGSGSVIVEDIGIGGTTDPVLFPIGIDNSYTPLTLKNPGTASDFSVRVIPGTYEFGLAGQNINSFVVDRTWIVGSSSASAVSLTLTWNAGTELSGFDRTQCAIVQNITGSGWIPLHNPVSATGSDPYSLSVSGVKNLELLGTAFAISGEHGLYPVRFISFSASRIENAVALEWRTTEEIHNHGYFVERSFGDTEVWEELAFVAAHEHAFGEQLYNWADHNAPTGNLFYRLRQVDIDGRNTYSAVIVVNGAETQQAVSLSLPSPHPLMSGRTSLLRFSLATPEQCRILLFDMLGRTTILAESREYPAGENLFTVDAGELRSGTYLLVLERGGERTARSVIVTK